MSKVKEKKENVVNRSEVIFYVSLNNNRRTIKGKKEDALKILNDEIISYGKKLYAFKLSIIENGKSYNFSLLSAVHYVTTGQISER